MAVKLSEQDKAERRRYFRVKDEIVLFYKELDTQDVPEPGEFKETVADSFSLTAALSHLTEDTRSQFKIVEKNHPDIAAYLKVLESKINLIAQAVLMNDTSFSNQPTREVDLSASGLAFDSENRIELGTVLEIKMILPPSLIAVITYGKVVHCKEYDDKGDTEFCFHVGVDFLHLQDQDREILIRHIVRKQMVQLRNRNTPS